MSTTLSRSQHRMRVIDRVIFVLACMTGAIALAYGDLAMVCAQIVIAMYAVRAGAWS